MFKKAKFWQISIQLHAELHIGRFQLIIIASVEKCWNPFYVEESDEVAAIN